MVDTDALALATPAGAAPRDALATRRRRRLRTLGGAITIAGLLALGAGCGDDDPGRVVVFANDTTCDAGEELVQASAQALDEAVRAAALDQGTFVGDTLSTVTEPTATFSIVKRFTTDKANGPGKTRDLTKQANEFIESDEAAPLAAGHLAGTPCGSDLLPVLQVVADTIDDVPSARDRGVDVVLVTNGIVIVDGTNFRRDDLSDARAGEIIADMRRNGLVPQLKGVNVYTIGVGTGDNLTPSQSRPIKRFWTALIGATGARQTSLANAGLFELDKGA